MLRLVLVLLSILSINFSFANPKSTDIKEFELRLFQNGKEVNIDDEIADLNKAPFVLEFRFLKELSILVNANHEEDSLLQAQKGLPYKEIVGFTHTGMAEYMFNPHEYINPRKDAPHFWWYSSPKDNRCDADGTKKMGKEIICRRTISQLSDTNGGYIALQKYPHQELNFVFVQKIAAKKPSDGMVEGERKVLKLRFKPLD